MSLEPGDIEIINNLIYKNADDIAVSISRSFERLEERIDALEARLYTRIGEVEDRLESSRQDISDSIGNVREEFRDVMRMKEREGELD
jgi:hypothetical protein